MNPPLFSHALGAFTLLAAVLFSGCATPPSPSSTKTSPEPMAKHQKQFAVKRETRQTVEVNSLVFTPASYDPNSETRWPLILFLHGSGERGTNLNLVSIHGPPKVVKDNPNFPFIVVSPQCPSGQIWSDATLLALLDEVIAHYRVDTTRVYLTGLSMGGYGTWSLGLSHPERFAALAPICGGGNLIDVLLPAPKNARILKNLPIWAFHGAKDTVVKPDESQRMIDALHRIGNSARLTIYPEAGHDSWTDTYNNQELYDWFLQQNRPKPSQQAKRKKRAAPAS